MPKNKDRDPNERKDYLFNIRLSPAFREAFESMCKIHQAKSYAEYLRGLIYLDALLASGHADLLDKPAWVTRDYGALIRRESEDLKRARDQAVHAHLEETSSQLHTALSTIIADAPSSALEKVAEILTQYAGRYAK